MTPVRWAVIGILGAVWWLVVFIWSFLNAVEDEWSGAEPYPVKGQWPYRWLW